MVCVNAQSCIAVLKYVQMVPSQSTVMLTLVSMPVVQLSKMPNVWLTIVEGAMLGGILTIRRSHVFVVSQVLSLCCKVECDIISLNLPHSSTIFPLHVIRSEGSSD